METGPASVVGLFIGEKLTLFGEENAIYVQNWTSFHQ